MKNLKQPLRNGKTIMELSVNGTPNLHITYGTRAEAAEEMSNQMSGSNRVSCSQRMFDDRIVTQHVYKDELGTCAYTLTTPIDPA